MRTSASPRALNMSKQSAVLMTPSSSSSMYHSSAAKEKVEYVVLFPPGAMGLELEPVIKSSEREIGCRVKDFYFGVDYNGIEPAQLERLVNTGDIICAIDDINVKSLPFPDVVDLLRSRRNNQRVIRFKNMNAMWSSGEKMISPSHVKRRERIQAPKFFNENVANGSQQLEEISPIKPAATNSRLSKSPKSTKSPLMQRQPLTPKQKSRPVISEQPQNMEMARTSLTPSAVKLLTQHGNTFSRDDDESFQINDPLLNEVQEVGVVIGKKAAEFAFIASESLSNHAQTALSHAAIVMPRFSVQDMDQVVQKKNDLLAELTRSVLMLREEEEKRVLLEREVESLHDLKRENEDLNEALAHKDSILDDYTLRVKTLETELAVARNESKQDQQLLKGNKSTIENLKSHNSELMQLIQSLQNEKQKMMEDNQHLSRSLEQAEVKAHQQEKQLMENMASLREKANMSITEKASEVTALRNHLELAQTKWEEHQAMVARKVKELEDQKVNIEGEATRTKAQNQQTIISLQELLQKRDDELQAANLTITELRSKLATIDITHSHLKNEYESCNALLSKAQTSVVEYQGEFQKMEKAIQDANQECADLRDQLATMTENHRLSLDVTKDMKREHEFYNDKIRLMELTITAQSNEIETLQKDLVRIEKAKDVSDEMMETTKTKYERDMKLMQSNIANLRKDLDETRTACQAMSFAFTTDLQRIMDNTALSQQQLSQEIEAQSTEIISLRAEIAAGKEKETVLLLELQRVNKEQDDFDRMFTEEKESLQAILVATQERKQSLENTVVALQEGLNSLQEKYQLAKQDCRAKEDDIASLRRQVSAMDQLVSSLKESSREEMHSQKEQLESTIEIYIGQLKKHEHDMLNLSTMLRVAQDESATLKESITQKEKELAHLRSMVDELKLSLQQEVEDHQHGKEEWQHYLQSQAKEFNQKMEACVREIEDVRKQCEDMDAIRCSLEEQIKCSEDKYFTDLEMKDNELVTLTEKLSELQASLQLKAQEIDTLHFDLVSAKESLAESKLAKESVELQKTLNVHDAEIKLAKVEADLQTLVVENGRLKDESSVFAAKAQSQEKYLQTNADRMKQVCLTMAATVSQEVQALKKSFVELRSEVVCLNGIHLNIFNAMETRTSSLSKELQERKQSAMSLTVQVSSQQSLQREKEALFQRVMQAEGRCMDLETKLLAHVTEAIGHAKQVEEKHESILALQATVVALEESLAMKQLEITTAQKQLQDAKEKAQTLEKDIVSASGNVESLTDEKARLLNQQEHLMEEIAVLKSSLNSAEHKGKMLEEQIRAMKERVLQYQELEQGNNESTLSTEDAVVQELTIVEQAIMSARSHEGELRQVVRESEEIISMLNSQVQDYQHDLQQRNDRIIVLEKKVAAAENTIENNLAEKQKLLLDVTALRQELERLTETSNFVEDSRYQLEEMLKFEKSKTSQLMSDITTSKEFIKAATVEMEQQSATIGQLQAKLHDAETHSLSLTQKARELESLLAEKSSEVQTLQRVIGTLQDEKSSAEHQCEEIMTTLDSTQVDMQRKYEVLLSKVTGLEAALLEREDELSATHTACHHLEKQREGLFATIQSIESTMKKLIEEKEAVLQDQKDLEGKLHSVEAALESAESMAQRLSVLTSSQAAEIESFHDIVLKYQAETSVKDEELNTLRSLLDEKKSLQEDQDNRFETLEAENKTLQHVVKENTKRISTLREVIQTLENALKLAEIRESEHAEVVKVFDQQSLERESRFQALQKQFDEVKQKLSEHRTQYEKQLELYRNENVEQKKALHHTNQALVLKTNELDALHRHISELLQTTVSPVRVEKSDGHDAPLESLKVIARKLPISDDSNDFDADPKHDKENVQQSTVQKQSPLHTRSSSKQSPSSATTGSPGAVDVWYTSESQWHDQLLTLSLNMHEILSYVFYLLQQAEQKNSAGLGIAEKESIKLWTTVSMLQQKAHEVLVRPPWINFLDPVQSLTAAHDLFSRVNGIAANQQKAGVTLPIIPGISNISPLAKNKLPADVIQQRESGVITVAMCKVVVTLLMKLVQKYKSHAQELQLQVDSAKNLHVKNYIMDKGETEDVVLEEEEDDSEVLRASITSEYISERISRWMKSVESYEKSQQESHSVEKVSSKPVAAATAFPASPSRSVAPVSSSSGTSSSKMESQDMKHANEEWLKSPPRGLTIPKSHTPDRQQHKQQLQQPAARSAHSPHSKRHTSVSSPLKSSDASSLVVSSSTPFDFNLSASLDMSSSPLRFDHMLQDQDDSMNSSTGDVWNISTDHSSSSIIVDNHLADARELSFSSALENSNTK